MSWVSVENEPRSGKPRLSKDGRPEEQAYVIRGLR